MMKKILVLLSLILIFAKTSFAQDFSGEHIKNFHSTVNINKDGTINVEEKILYDFDNLQRHGIFREIPYLKTNEDDEKFKLDFTEFSVTDENGRRYPYKKTADVSNKQVKLKIGHPDKTITGVHTYVIRYKVAGALTYFSDHDELYWNSTGNDWTVPMEKASAKITFPTTVDGMQLRLTCYTGPPGSTVRECTGSTEEGVALFVAEKSFAANEGMTIVLGFPKNIVSILEPKPYVTFWNRSYGKLLAFSFFMTALLWYVFYPLWIIIKWFKYGRDPSTRFARSGQVRAWFDPPKAKDGRDLTPAEVGSLIDETVQQRDISAIIVDLARRGYLKIEEKKKNDFYFIRRSSKSEGGLLPFEKKMLDGIFGTEDMVRLKDQKLYETIAEVKKNLYEGLVREGFFPKNPLSTRTYYYVIAFIGLITLNVHLSLICIIFGRAMPRKTIFGAEAANVAKSLRNFLASQERQLEFQAKNQMMFEKLLPFAVAFGVEKIWAQRFKDIDLKPPEWYVGPPAGGFNSTTFTRSLNSSLSSFAQSATPTSSSSGFSSGSSGGSSGGGGGGGGGGSW